MSYGIDTIKVGYNLSPSEIDLNGWRHTSHSLVSEIDEKVYADDYRKYYTTLNGTYITMKYVPTDYKGNTFNMLFIEFSLPKLVFGCNHRDIDDWPAAFRIANEVIATIPSLPPLPDIRDAILYCIALCANLKVGEEDVSDYIQALYKGHHPHRTTKPYGKNGVMFVSKEASTCIYDKWKECGCEKAKGILRYEFAMRTRWKVSKWTGDARSTLRSITKDMVRDLLSKDMKMLHLDTHMVCDRLNAEEILSKKYSPCVVQRLLGHLAMRRTMTVEQMNQAGYKSASIRRSDKLLAAAGISSLSIDSKKTLPALILFLGKTNSAKNLHKLPSDTKTLELGGIYPTDFYNPAPLSYNKFTEQPHERQEERSNIRPRAP